jgi:hypothetical protein
MLYTDTKNARNGQIKKKYIYYHYLGCATHFGLTLSKLASGTGNKTYRLDMSVINLTNKEYTNICLWLYFKHFEKEIHDNTEVV